MSFELSPAIAVAVTARRRHSDQRDERRRDGSILLTFPVYDLAEAARWAMSFGAEVTVVAPPSAVVVAESLAKEIAAHYPPKESAVRSA